MAARAVRMAAPAQDFHRPLLPQSRIISPQQEAFRSPLSQGRPSAPEEALRSPALRTRLSATEDAARPPTRRTELPEAAPSPAKEAPSLAAAAGGRGSLPAKPARSWLLATSGGSGPQVLRQQSSQDYPVARSSCSSQRDVPESLERAEAVWRQRLFEAERQRAAEAVQWEKRLASTSLELQLAREEVRCQRQLVFEAKTAGAAHAKALAWCGAELIAARQEARSEGTEQHLVEARRSASAGEAAGGSQEAPRAAADAAACCSTAAWQEEVAAARSAREAEEAATVAEVRASCERALLELCDVHARQLREQESQLEAALAQRDAELRVAREELACRPVQAAADTESALVELCQMHDAELRRREAEFEAALASRDEELRAALEEKRRWQASRSLKDEQIRAALDQHRQAQAALNRFNEEIRSDLREQRHFDEAGRPSERAAGTDRWRKQTAGVEDSKAERWQSRRTESAEELEDWKRRPTASIADLEDWKRRPTASTADLEATDAWQHRPTVAVDAFEVAAECTDD